MSTVTSHRNVMRPYKRHVRCLILLAAIPVSIKLYFLFKITFIGENEISYSDSVEISGNSPDFGQDIIKSSCEMVIAVILCKDTADVTVNENSKRTTARDFSRQINQLIVLLKSIVILSKVMKLTAEDCVKVIIISDVVEHYDSVMDIIYDEEEWSEDFLKYLKFVHYPVKYPAGTTWMKTLFRPCATFRLFLPDILPETYERIIYLDTDIIFFRSIQELWSEFDKFSNETIAAMSSCLNHYGSKANKVPYFGTSGLNAGIQLMNLTRMRATLWTRKIRMVTEMYKHKIKLADQDILNIYFHFFPEQLYEFSCEWNFRPLNCRKNSFCQNVSISNGISALHGNALSFTTQGPESWFHEVFRHYKQTKLNSQFSMRTHVLSLSKALTRHERNEIKTDCMRYSGFTKILLNRLQRLV